MYCDDQKPALSGDAQKENLQKMQKEGSRRDSNPGPLTISK